MKKTKIQETRTNVKMSTWKALTNATTDGERIMAIMDYAFANGLAANAPYPVSQSINSIDYNALFDLP